MKTYKFKVDQIPVVVWGEDNRKLFIAVHGFSSHKEDFVIKLFAQEAINKGYCVISFDLPEHGDRKTGIQETSVQDYLHDLDLVYKFAEEKGTPEGVFACSLGAYFSLLSYKGKPLNKSIFLSPVIDMSQIIDNMMEARSISKKQLMNAGKIQTTDGLTFFWNYYSYVKANSVKIWNIQTAILCGSKDNVCDISTVMAFVKRNKCRFDIMEDGEHYFHTDTQLRFFAEWLKQIV
jgi:hypothetical protein